MKAPLASDKKSNLKKTSLGSLHLRGKSLKYKKNKTNKRR